MDPVVHFELPAVDRDRMAAFYGSVFGWETDKLGPEMGEYTVVTTTQTNESGPTTPGAINGGFYLRTAQTREQSPSVVISVANTDQALIEIEQAGGTRLDEPMDIPGVGRYAAFLDTEGNRLSVLQALPRGTG